MKSNQCLHAVFYLGLRHTGKGRGLGREGFSSRSAVRDRQHRGGGLGGRNLELSHQGDVASIFLMVSQAAFPDG